MFIYLYYSVLFISFFFYFIERILNTRVFHILINFFLISLILFASLRSNGVDYDGYYNDYYRTEKSIFDYLYAPLVDLFNFINLPYSFFLFLQIALFLFTLYKYCRSHLFDFTLVLLLYSTHFFVIRDLSQSRIAFAFTFYLLYELSEKKYYKIFFTFCSIGIHFSIFPIFIIRNWIKFLEDKWYAIYLHVISFILLLIFGSFLIQRAYFLDPRIEIYLNWKEPGYGDVLLNYFFIYFLIFILSINTVLQLLKFNKLFLIEQDLIILFIYGIIIGISFSSFAIFSTRLTSIFATFYLFIISKWANLFYYKYNYKKFISFLLNILLLLIFIILLLRRDNYEIIKSVVF